MTFLIQQTLIYAVPLMIVALAGVFSERSGIINLALEGIMIFGAFMGVLFVNLAQTAGWFMAAKAAKDWAALQGFEVLAMLVAAACGALFSLLLSFASINRRHCAEPHGARPGAVLHPHDRQPEHAADGQRRLCQLVHDQENDPGL